MHRFLPLLILVVAACASDEAPLVATNVVLKAPPPGMTMSAGYLTLHNNTADAITITRLHSPQYGAVEMHETVISDGVSRMVALESVTIPARRSVRFEPGAKHLMLMRPAGDFATASLEFYAGPDRVLTVEAAITR